MLSRGAGPCYDRPGRYQDGISQLCLDDRTLPATLGVLWPRRPDSQLSVTIGRRKESAFCCQHFKPHPGLMPSPYVQDFQAHLYTNINIHLFKKKMAWYNQDY